jgi:hypothetical protein
MSDVPLTITPAEKDFLSRLLDQTVNSERLELHHTDRRAYRELIRGEIALAESLLVKVRESASG